MVETFARRNRGRPDSLSPGVVAFNEAQRLALDVAKLAVSSFGDGRWPPASALAELLHPPTLPELKAQIAGFAPIDARSRR